MKHNILLFKQLLDVYIDKRDYVAALSLVCQAHDKAEDASEKAALERQILEFAPLADNQIKDEAVAKEAYLTRRADTVNRVNHAAMVFGAKLSMFLREHGISIRKDGSFTQKYEDKLREALHETGCENVAFWARPKGYQEDVIRLSVWASYADMSGNYRRYETLEDLAETGDHSRVQVRPTDRTPEQYVRAENELERAKIEKRELLAKISKLMAICSE